MWWNCCLQIGYAIVRRLVQFVPCNTCIANHISLAADEALKVLCCSILLKFTWCSNLLKVTRCSNLLSFTRCFNPFKVTRCSNPLKVAWCSNPLKVTRCSNLLKVTWLHGRDSLLVQSAALVIERLRVRIPAGAAGEFSSSS